jgi:uncharacterized protein
LNKLFFLGILLLSGAVPADAAEESLPAWRIAIYDFCKANLQHSAWGVAHCERNYVLALAVAKEEELKVDEDVLYAAAFFHDIGAFEPYLREEVNHGERSADVAGEILKRAGFPADKVPKVEEAIRGHMFYARVGESPEAVVLHDADTLDFMGNIGIARILSLTGKHRWAQTLREAINTIEKFSTELPDKLVTKAAKKIAEKRAAESKKFVEAINAQSNQGTSL